MRTRVTNLGTVQSVKQNPIIRKLLTRKVMFVKDFLGKQ